MTISIRPATAADLPLIAQLIRDLAEYERLAHEVRFDDQVLAAKLHGCGAVAVLGENAAHATACIKQKHSEVFAVGFAHACFNNANAHTIYGQ